MHMHCVCGYSHSCFYFVYFIQEIEVRQFSIWNHYVIYEQKYISSPFLLILNTGYYFAYKNFYIFTNWRARRQKCLYSISTIKLPYATNIFLSFKFLFWPVERKVVKLKVVRILFLSRNIGQFNQNHRRIYWYSKKVHCCFAFVWSWITHSESFMSCFLLV